MFNLIKTILSGCVCAVICGSAGMVFAQDQAARQSFIQANLAYRQNKYDAAISGYQKAVEQGFVSGNVYYNLGNSYFKKGDIGKALLNYERARIFIPADSDLKANYEYALAELNLPESAGGGRLALAVNNLFGFFDVDGLAVWIFVLSLLFFGSLTAALAWRKLRSAVKYLSLVLIFLAVVSIMALSRRISLIEKGAVVIAGDAEVRFEPMASATVYFKAPEGSFVEIVEKYDNWYKIKRPDNKAGWVDKSRVELISD